MLDPGAERERLAAQALGLVEAAVAQRATSPPPGREPAVHRLAHLLREALGERDLAIGRSDVAERELGAEAELVAGECRRAVADALGEREHVARDREPLRDVVRSEHRPRARGERGHERGRIAAALRKRDRLGRELHARRDRLRVRRGADEAREYARA